MKIEKRHLFPFRIRILNPDRTCPKLDPLPRSNSLLQSQRISTYSDGGELRGSSTLFGRLVFTRWLGFGQILRDRDFPFRKPAGKGTCALRSKRGTKRGTKCVFSGALMKRVKGQSYGNRSSGPTLGATKLDRFTVKPYPARSSDLRRISS